MNELLEKGQIFRIIPQNFKNSNAGEIIEIKDKNFTLELKQKAEGILPNKIMEFYSQTKNGMLYFTGNATEVNENQICVSIPAKHRFLQRRAFTRVKFSQNIESYLHEKTHSFKILDISAGGMKIKSKDNPGLDTDLFFEIPISQRTTIKCEYEPIRIEKNDDGTYTLSGRFLNLENFDKMLLIQFCMKKKIEIANR